MRLMKAFIAALIGVFALTSVQAATFVPPTGKASGDSVIEFVKKKKHKKKHKKKKGKAGTCGTYKYFSKKKGKCVDARGKK